MKTSNIFLIIAVSFMGLVCCSRNDHTNEQYHSDWKDQSMIQTVCKDSTVFEFALRDKKSKEVIFFLERSNPEGVVVIPSKIKCKGDTYKVTQIGTGAFRDEYVTSVTIPSSVTSIGDQAFYGCTGLNSVTIPNSVTIIGDQAFYGCTGLNSVTIPNSVTIIGYQAFHGCAGLTSIIIPSSVTSIGKYAFEGCTSLTSITIPSSVTSIDWAFRGCTSLTSVTIPSSVSEMHYTFSDCTGLTSVTIPEGVTIMDGVFDGCTSLTSVTIPEGVTIMNNAFRGCTSLTSVTIPESVMSIEASFYGCESLTSVTMPHVSPHDGLFDPADPTIGSFAFAYCSGLTSIAIPEGVTNIEEYAFLGCTGLTSITIPASVTSIGDYAFSGCTGLTTVIRQNPHLQIDYDKVFPDFGKKQSSNVVLNNNVQDTPTEEFRMGELIGLMDKDARYYQFTQNDLMPLSAKELTYLRNSVYAKHGYVFKSQELNDYFKLFSWYHPNPNVTESVLNDMEKTNMNFIKNYQEQNGKTYKPQ